MRENNKKMNNIKSKTLSALLIFTVILSLCSCENNKNNKQTKNQIDTNSVESTYNRSLPTEIETTELKETEIEKVETQKGSDFEFTYKDIPEYNGNPSVIINGNEPAFAEDEITTDVFEKYSDLDSLGRCHVAFANICEEIMPTEQRGAIGHIKPSGWNTIKYPDLIEDNYLYNRCHLIAYSLAGENDNEKNLITGTHYLNYEGMQPYELEVLNFIRYTKSDAHVLYRVTPIYKDDELVARGVLMEALSVEDKGEGIKFCVFVYNVQPGIELNYATGDSKAIEEPNTTETEIQSTTSGNDEYYILNTNTHRFHKPDCDSVNQMSDRNKAEYHGSREDLVSKGYKPCGNCHP